MSGEDKKNKEQKYLDVVFKLLYLIIALMILAGMLVYINVAGLPDVFKSKDDSKIILADIPVKAKETKSEFWIAPDTLSITNDDAGKKNKIRKNAYSKYFFLFRTEWDYSTFK
jgi:hypothetical protein